MKTEAGTCLTAHMAAYSPTVNSQHKKEMHGKAPNFRVAITRADWCQNTTWSSALHIKIKQKECNVILSKIMCQGSTPKPSATELPKPMSFMDNVRTETI